MKPFPYPPATSSRAADALTCVAFATAFLGALALLSLGREGPAQLVAGVATFYAVTTTLVAHALLTGPRPGVDPEGETDEARRSKLVGVWQIVGLTCVVLLALGLAAPRLLSPIAFFPLLVPVSGLLRRAVVGLVDGGRVVGDPGPVGPAER